MSRTGDPATDGPPPHDGVGAPELGADAADELAYRLRQQEILSEFGMFALRCRDEDELFREATRVGAAGMNVELCKLLQYREDEDDLLMRAGVGWAPGTVGTATLRTDLESPAGFAFRTGQPLISNHLAEETRFRTPELLAKHGVRRALNVPVKDGGRPYGVLEVDSRTPDKFSFADVAFLQGVSNMVSVALERREAERALAEAEARQAVMTRELRHRVKNLFAVVGSLLNVSRREAEAMGRPEDAIRLASDRLAALSRASDVGIGDAAEEGRLYDAHALSREVLAPYGERVRVDGVTPTLTQRHVTPLGLLLHELATNAVKYGGLSRDGGEVRLDWSCEEGTAAFTWTETGGPPPKPSGTDGNRGFGERLMRSVLPPIGGTIERDWQETGLTLRVRFDL